MKSNFKSSPFDPLILKAVQCSSEIEERKIFGIIHDFSHVLRIIYLDMDELRERMRQECKELEEKYSELIRNSGEKKKTELEWDQTVIGGVDILYKVRILYFNFINQINQLRYALKKLNLSFPKGEEVRFYRNKVTEHWNEYIDLESVEKSVAFNSEVIPIPNNGLYSEEEKKDLVKLFEELKNDNELIDLSSALTPTAISEGIYSSLKKVRLIPDKRMEKMNTEEKELISILFQYGFPPPIGDIKAYSEELTQFLEEKILDPLINKKCETTQPFIKNF